MESNKEEAVKCLKIAQKELTEGNTGKAFRFVNKSLKLYPSDVATRMLKEIESLSKNSPPSMDGEQLNKKREVPDTSTLHGTSAETASPSYTAAQKNLVNRVNNSKDFYGILGVSKDATEPDLKKAYRKMALQLHPDKNCAPGATEAFKSVGKAFSVLSDPEKRRRYDVYGHEAVNHLHRGRRDSTEDEFEQSDFDPQELFNMFFGGGFPSGNVRVFRRGNTYYYDRRPRQNEGQDQHRNDPRALIQLLPIILIFSLTLLSNFMSTDPPYSLSKKSGFPFKKTTSNLNVKFYVNADFDATYKKGSDSLQNLENTIESEYFNYLKNRCYQETVERETLRRKGLYFGSADMVERSKTMPTPYCDDLQRLKNKYS